MCFDNNRRCDRFWYENSNQAGRFSEAQLAEIRKVAFSKLICENSDTIGEVTRSVFDLPHNFLNPRVPCRSLPAMDLTPWRDQDATCVVLGKTIALGASSLVSPCTSCTCTTEGVSKFIKVSCLSDVNDDHVTAPVPVVARQLPAAAQRSRSRRPARRQRVPRPVRVLGQSGAGRSGSRSAAPAAAAAAAAEAGAAASPADPRRTPPA